MTWTSTSLLYDRARTDPSACFESPEALLGSPELSRPEKIDLLRRWYRMVIARSGEPRVARGGLLSTRVARCLHFAFRGYFPEAPAAEGEPAGA
jgi:hypothetical protein